MKLDDALSILDDVPNYQAFLTVDELKASAHQLAQDHPRTVEVLPLGRSRQGDPIEALKIGDGPKKAMLFAMPHPNEPIGSMMLEYLSRRLAEDDALRDALGYTWYLIKCIDPDGTRLNEGWFKGPFSIDNYA
ncbi:MAG: peptidase, partial [Anaerolineae bacterium]